MRYLRLSAATTVVSVLLAGCGKSTSPPRVYTTAAKGAITVERLIDDFEKAHATGDADAAMQMFYWHSPDDERVFQEVHWVSIETLFEKPVDSVDVIPVGTEKESRHPAARTALPVVSHLRITTNTTSTGRSEHTLMIGRNENGFYFVPALNPPLDE